MEMPMAMYLQQWLSWSCLHLCYNTYRPVLESVNTPATCLWRLFTCTRNNRCPSYLSLKALHMYSEQQMSQLLVSEGSSHVLGTTNVPATCLWRLLTCTRNNKSPTYLSLKALHMYSEQQMSQLLVSEGSSHVFGTSNVPATCVHY